MAEGFRAVKRCIRGAAPSSIDILGKLGDAEIERVFSFVCADFTSLAAVAPVDRRFSQTVHKSGSWEDSLIRVPRACLDKDQLRIRLMALAAANWNLAREVRLPAHVMRSSVKEIIHTVWPNLDITVDAAGPYPLFCMDSSILQVGRRSGLHLFEPRYAWMCKRLLDAHKAGETDLQFGWVTSPARGSLCQAIRLQQTPNGYNVEFICVAKFTIVEQWEEAVPRSRRVPKLLHGYLRLDDDLLQLREASDGESGAGDDAGEEEESEEEDEEESEED